MKILGLDSSGQVASVAIGDNGVLIGEYTINHKLTHAKTLLPMIEELMARLEVKQTDLDAIAITSGPGSFTGLRIGAATAKGLGLALHKPLICVPTVDVLAYRLWGIGGLICPLMDARRNQTYTGLYRFTNGKMEVVRKQCAIALTEILSDINQRGENVTFLGDGVPVFFEDIKEQCSVPYQYAPMHKRLQSAAALIDLAEIYAGEGKLTHADDFRPEYLRMSQAERERMERLQATGEELS